MIISIVANTAKNSESFGFIRPIADSNLISKILVFGDGALEKNTKVEYFKDIVTMPKVLKLIYRLLNVIYRSRNSDAIIGIYEIPHGFIAYLAGLILKKKTILCIIGNPAYTKIRKGIRLWLMNLMIKKMNTTTITGSNSKNFLAEMGHDANRLFILPNSIDITNFKPFYFRKQYDIISLGRLSTEKELLNFLKIIKKIKKHFPNICAAIAGAGSQRALLEEESRKLHLESNVTFLGYIENKIEFYNKGKIFLLTSSTEGLPRTLIESMACGVPCIASDVGDIKDLIVNGETGFLVRDYSDLDSFVIKILDLLKDNTIYEKINKNAIDIVRKHYSYQASTKFWESIL